MSLIGSHFGFACTFLLLICPSIAICQVDNRDKYTASVGATTDLSFCAVTNILSSAHIQDGKVYFWKYGDNSLLFEDSLLGHEESIYSVSFDKSGARLATCGLDRWIRIWDLKTRKTVFEYEAKDEHPSKVCLSPDGKKLAVATMTGVIYVFDADDSKRVTLLKGHTKVVNYVKFNSDGKCLATGGHDTSIHVWNMKTLELHRCLNGHSGVICGLNFTEKDSHLVSLSRDKTLRDWDIETKKCNITDLKDFSGDVIALSLDSSRIAVCEKPEKEIRLLDSKGNILRKYESKIVPNRLLFLPTNQHLAIGGNNGDVKLWHIDEKAK